MTRQERMARRALIVRRWKAYRVGQVQRELWKERRARVDKIATETDETAGAPDDLLAELSDDLLG